MHDVRVDFNSKVTSGRASVSPAIVNLQVFKMSIRPRTDVTPHELLTNIWQLVPRPLRKDRQYSQGRAVPARQSRQISQGRAVRAEQFNKQFRHPPFPDPWIDYK